MLCFLWEDANLNRGSVPIQINGEDSPNSKAWLLARYGRSIWQIYHPVVQRQRKGFAYKRCKVHFIKCIYFIWFLCHECIRGDLVDAFPPPILQRWTRLHNGHFYTHLVNVVDELTTDEKIWFNLQFAKLDSLC